MRSVIIFVLVLLGCESAEAKPKRSRIVVRLHTVDASIQCEMDDVFNELRRRFRVALPGVDVQFGYRGDHAIEAFSLLTLEGFWSGDLYHYWKDRIPPEEGVITLVALPPLYTEQGKMYGGWASNTCKPAGGWAFINAETGNVSRNSFTASHEIGHLLGATDRCDPNRVEPSPMCAEDAPQIKLMPDPHFDKITIRQMARCLGVRRLAGRRLCVGKCRKNKRG